MCLTPRSEAGNNSGIAFNTRSRLLYLDVMLWHRCLEMKCRLLIDKWLAANPADSRALAVFGTRKNQQKIFGT